MQLLLLQECQLLPCKITLSDNGIALCGSIARGSRQPDGTQQTPVPGGPSSRWKDTLQFSGRRGGVFVSSGLAKEFSADDPAKLL